MSSQQDSLEEALIEEELNALTRPQQLQPKWGDMKAAVSLWEQGRGGSEEGGLSDPNLHRFNHYADKQLQHLVVTEQFDFARIAVMLNYIFREERAKFTETACRERWDELHRLRENLEGVRVKRMEDKRASSVSVFTNPFSLYNLQEMLDRLQQTERERPSEDSPTPASTTTGYNIFKNSIRQIDDMEEYQRREREMKQALTLAQDPSLIVRDKLMHFSPYYDRLHEFEVHEEELTEEKMREIMSVPIEMERMEVELRVKDMNETAEGWKQKRTKREEQRTNREEHKYDIEEDWDEYESD